MRSAEYSLFFRCRKERIHAQNTKIGSVLNAYFFHYATEELGIELLMTPTDYGVFKNVSLFDPKFQYVRS